MSDGESGITFATWFVFAFPVAVINVLLAWLCLQVVYFGLRNLFKSGDKSEGEAVKKIIRSQYDSLGNMSFAEKAVMVLFVILVLCWFTLEPEFVPGWGSLFKHGYISDAVPAMIICCLLFVFPSSRNQNNANKSSATLLDWKTFNRKFPWGVALLLGGGFALAHACKESGLSLWLARMMAVMTGIPEWAMIAVICLVISLSTEVTTNTAVCTIFMPILADLAKGIHVHPIYIMLPAAISSSFAFMLPVATPPNTIAFSYGYLRIIDMVKVGWILNLLCVVIVTIAINTWGMAYFRLDVYPEWAESKCAYGLLLMAFYWTTETFPVAITATLPVILFPMMGISKVGDLASKYFHHITFVLIGGLAVAIAIEKWNVHKRIALRLLLTMGTTPKWLMLGFMLTTSFLSMWISNTATTSIMIPIAQAVLTQLMGMRVSRDQLKPDQDTRNDEKNIHTIQEMYVNGDTKVALDLPDVEPSESVGITIQQPDPDGKQKLTIQQAHQSVEQPEPVEGFVFE
ncbi:Solute carrier family 13 member 5 [Mizuhopecten yessoensis]|uniref:Solute carrier family 13 member 5 n=1 Tax=Mizuhopecten yessoensis TaxID=6573 RepID=A0A210PPU7_MIZYE|nr:Solute carrier family 13 member 5 [Mizuhopecten yessoensis]